MNKEMFYTVKKLAGVIVRTETESDDNQAIAASLAADVMQFGYILTPALFNKLSKAEKSELVTINAELIQVLQNLKGADVRYTPMYPNFPEQVMNIDEATLLHDQLSHYESNGTFIPETEIEKRPYAQEDIEYHSLDAITQEEFEGLFTALLASNDSLSEEDRDVIEHFLDNDGKYTLKEPINGIPFKETMCIIANRQLKADKSISEYVNTATDVLRVVSWYNEGDASLATNTKFKSLPRAKRKILCEALDEIAKKNMNAFKDDLLRHSGSFNKLLHNIHVGDYSKRLYECAKTVRDNSVKHQSFNAKVQDLIANKNDYKAAMNELKKRPSEYARLLDKLLRMSNENTDVVTTFNEIVDDVPSKILFQVLGHLKTRMRKQDFTVVFPKGQVQKALRVERDYDALSPVTVSALMKIITDSLQARFSTLEPLGNVYVHPQLKEAPLPTSQRNASTALDVVARGTRMHIGDKNTLRFFVYWKGQDIDLSSTFYDDQFNLTNQVSYTNLRSNTINSYHSGDIVSAPRGASEFIDIDLQSAEDAGVRYIAMNVYVYSGPSFSEHEICYAGFMTRDKPNSNEIYDPKTVEQKVDMRQQSRSCIPFMFDVKERKAIWVDLNIDNRNQYHAPNNTETNAASVQEIMQNTVSLYESRATLYDLFEQHGLARGNLVGAPEDADVIYAFGSNSNVKPTDINVINSEYIV